MHIAILLPTVLGLAVALPMQEAQVYKILSSTDIATRNSALEQTLLDVIESLREVMLTGSGDIPVLDPFQLDHLHLELDDLGFEGGFVTVGDVIVNRLSTFEIDNLSVRMSSILPPRYTVEIEGKVPVLEIDTDKYDMSITVTGFNVFGRGTAKMSIIEPRIKASFVLGVGIIGGINLNMVSANVGFMLGGFKPEITGMFDSDVANDFINLFLANLVPEMVEFFEEDITTFLSAVVLEMANEILADLDVGSIINPNTVLETADVYTLENMPYLEIKV